MSLNEIKTVYRQLSKLYHPDSPTGNEEKFRDINRAWKDIENVYKRKRISTTENDGMYIHKSLFNVIKEAM